MKLKELRQRKGLKLKEVSKQLGYKYPSGYHKIERGDQELTLEQAKKLSVIYEVDLDIFLI